MNYSHYRVGPGCQPTPPVSDSETGEAATTALTTAKLADGDSSGEMDDTYMIYVTRRIDQCDYCDLGLTEGSSSSGMAAW